MNLLTRIEGGMFYTNTFWFLFCPQMYIDDEGYALDGYPLMIAKSEQLSLMYWGDYSWLEDPYNKQLKLDLFSFWRIVFNTYWGLGWYLFNHLLFDAPALFSIT